MGIRKGIRKMLGIHVNCGDSECIKNQKATIRSMTALLSSGIDTWKKEYIKERLAGNIHTLEKNVKED